MPMQIGTRFSVAIHILLAVEVFREERKVTSDFIAASVNTNPVVIRKIMGLLRDAGLIEIAAGTGGIRLSREPGSISLLDVYRAADQVKDGRLFRVHEDTAPLCPVGGNIGELLEGPLGAAQAALEAQLAASSLEGLLADLDRLRRRKARSGPGRPRSPRTRP
jgi:DNA-binding IscR family transcriptional regulator